MAFIMPSKRSSLRVLVLGRRLLASSVRYPAPAATFNFRLQADGSGPVTSDGEATVGAPVGAAPRRNQEVDVLRGVAAFWVVLSHYLPYWKRYLGWAPIIVPNTWGQYAVWLFFIISGFVIFSTLDRSKTVTDFAVLRFSRLYPAYWATLLFATSVGALVFGNHVWLRGLVANLTMFEEFFGFPGADNVYWSLTVELGFYLLAGTLFALRLHRRPQVVVAAWLGAAVIWVLTLRTPGADHRDWFALLLALDFSPFFAIGIVLYDVTKHGWSASRIGLIAFAMIAEFVIAGWTGLGVAVVVAGLVGLAIHGHLRFLVSKGTLWLGSISYSLYLIHRNLGYDLLSWLHAHGLGPGVAVPLTILGALGLATVTTHAIEKPAMRQIRLWYARRNATRS
jgi:peptidoglycan/LPS O-acetylase OafA/YrhL